MTKETKQVVVIRKDLKIRRGKECSQAGHASCAFLARRISKEPDGPVKLSEAEKEWIKSSYKKICLCVESEKELLEINKRAKEAGLECHMIQDSGKTEFHGVPTYTCLAIGPDWDERIDPVTKNLRLY